MGRKPLFEEPMTKAQYNKRYIQNHPEKVKENNHKYKDYKLKYYHLNKEKINARRRELYKLKKDKKSKELKTT